MILIIIAFLNHNGTKRIVSFMKNAVKDLQHSNYMIKTEFNYMYMYVTIINLWNLVHRLLNFYVKNNKVYLPTLSNMLGIVLIIGIRRYFYNIMCT